MSYKSRPAKFAFYRLFFVVLLFTIGVACLGLVVAEHFFGFRLTLSKSEVINDAISFGSIISGLLSMIYGFILYRLMTDRRLQASERRKRQVPIEFSDRRSGIDRRTGKPC